MERIIGTCFNMIQAGDTAMTSGGTMFHEVGYAGLPASSQPACVCSGEIIHVSADRKRELLNTGGETIVARPIGAARSLLLEEAHASGN
jgi:hypothetical protein